MASTLQTPFAWAEQLLAVAEGALPATAGGAIPRSFVAAGLPALDCCPQLTVHTAGHGLLPTSAPGALTVGHRRTVGQVRYIRFIITLVRCAPVPGEKGVPPTPEAQAAIAAILNEDALAVIAAVNTADRAGTLFGGLCKEFYYDGATSLDPAGGCVGWLFNYRASIEGLGNLVAKVTPTQELERFLYGEDGPVFRHLAVLAAQVETLAKLNATGIPVQGANNPEGRGPRVQTGRLRSSITWSPGRDAKGPYVDIGTPVKYGYYLETGLRNGATYPFLRPALAAV